MISTIKFSAGGSKSLFISDYLANENLIIFVHGFRGTAEDTWGEFPEFCETSEAFPNHDIIFYGYRAGRARANMSGGLLFDAINSIFDRNGYANKHYLIGRRAKEYANIFLVGHSLGCLVTRHALLEAMKSGASWSNRTKLLHFAPAHRGADVAKLLLGSGFFSRIPLGNLAGLLLRVYYPCILDLRQGSDFLRSIQEAVSVRCADSKYAPNIAAILTIFGELESIVDISDYGCDAPHKRIEGRGHTNLVKLDINDYRQPCDEIRSCLRR